MDALLFLSVIDFTSEKYITFTGHRYSWYLQMKIRRGPRGIQSFDTQGVHPRPKFCPKCIVKFLLKDQKVSKGAINSL